MEKKIVYTINIQYFFPKKQTAFREDAKFPQTSEIHLFLKETVNVEEGIKVRSERNT